MPIFSRLSALDCYPTIQHDLISNK